MALGETETCVVMDDATVQCSGIFDFGEVGTAESDLVARNVSDLDDDEDTVVMVEGGFSHTCAVMTSGTLKCFGYGGYGQLGTSSTDDSYVPVTVPIAGNVTQVALGDYHTVALLSNGSIMAFGYNQYGQLGIGTTAFSYTSPQLVVSLGTTVTQITAARDATCALLKTGAVTCWGANENAQLGLGYVSTYQPVPASVSGMSGTAVKVVTGGWHTCAILTTGQLECWGQNYYGQLGGGFFGGLYNPFIVSGLGGYVTQIALGQISTCALLIGSTVLQCWGANYNGQLGIGSVYIAESFPATVYSLSGSNMTRIVHKGLFAAVLLANGTVKAWGLNSYGNLGTGDVLDRSLPATSTAVQDAGGAKDIGIGLYHTCVVTNANRLACFGLNDEGALGRVATTLTVSTALSGSVRQISLSAKAGCAVWEDGGMKCWGDNNDYGVAGVNSSLRILTPTQVGSNVSSVAASLWHVCSVLKTGALACQGMNTYGQLGQNTTTSSNVPLVVSSLPGSVKQVAVGRFSTCAVLVDGTLYCWGYNWACNLGLGDIDTRTYPVNVTSIGGAVSEVATSYYHSCAVLLDGSLQCWGYGPGGRTGFADELTRSIPFTVSTGGSVSQVAVSTSHTCAVTSTGGLKCWGQNAQGQLGLGHRVYQNTPQDVTTGGTVVSLALSDYHTCVILSTNAMECWGGNSAGQLGLGDTVDRLTPQFVVSAATYTPTNSPTRSPTHAPSMSPTRAPTRTPSKSPTHAPTHAPSKSPTRAPTNSPTKFPTHAPTNSPTDSPTRAPSSSPTLTPTNSPTDSPTRAPSQSPTLAPTRAPSHLPTVLSPSSTTLVPSSASGGRSGAFFWGISVAVAMTAW